MPLKKRFHVGDRVTRVGGVGLSNGDVGTITKISLEVIFVRWVANSNLIAHEYAANLDFYDETEIITLEN